MKVFCWIIFGFILTTFVLDHEVENEERKLMKIIQVGITGLCMVVAISPTGIFIIMSYSLGRLIGMKVIKERKL
jgi:hypothetical protein